MFDPASTAATTAANLLMNPRVQSAVVDIVGGIYGRIFSSDQTAGPDADSTIKLSASEQLLLDHLRAIDERVRAMPTNDEMALAMSSLEARLNASMRWQPYAIAALVALNAATLSILLLG